MLTTLGAGSFISDYNLFIDFPYRVLPGLWKGVPFSLPLLVILGSHEMAHYLNSRRHRVEATLPYFIPFPNIFGTLGAVIKIKSPIQNRNALIDIGSSGPIIGFMFSVAACIVGLSLSGPEAVSGPDAVDGLMLGPSLLYYALIHLLVDADVTRQAIELHPVAVAGWVGLFVTSINLMPVGQLDGGHVAYAFFGKWHRPVSRIFMVLLGLMGVFIFPGWLIWALLLLFIGTKHPPVEDPYAPLDVGRKLEGLASLIIFIITFPPVPIIIPM